MRPLRVSITTGVALALVVAGCTTREVVAPGTTDPNTVASSPPTDEIVTVPVDTSAPPTTSPETTTTSDPLTVESIDTTSTLPAPEPPSGNPTATATEVFAGGDADGWLFLGRWSGSAWERAVAEDGSLLEFATDEGAEVTIHEADRAPIDGAVTGTSAACSNGLSGPTITPNARAPEEPGFGYRSVAFTADWNTQPRPIAVVDADIEAYVEAGRAAFAGDGVDVSTGSIEQIVLADLDGDGDTESLVAFDGNRFAGLLLIDADSGAAITVDRDVAEVTTPTTVAEGDEQPDQVVGPVDTYRTLTIADLNGDGLMEFAVHSWVGDDATVTINTYDGTDVTARLSATC